MEIPANTAFKFIGKYNPDTDYVLKGVNISKMF
jgi:hypothetical protein